MSSAEFWARKLGGGQAPPPHIPAPVSPSPVTPGAWWQAPAAVAAPTPQHQGVADSGMVQFTYQQLKAMRADEMSQDQMEALAQIELGFEKYNHNCPACGSTNFLPQGTRIGSYRMGTDKCFECGASSSAITMSPEAAVGGNPGKPSRHARSADGGQGNYGRHHSQLPQQFVPTA